MTDPSDRRLNEISVGFQQTEFFSRPLLGVTVVARIGERAATISDQRSMFIELSFRGIIALFVICDAFPEDIPFFRSAKMIGQLYLVVRALGSNFVLPRGHVVDKEDVDERKRKEIPAPKDPPEPPPPPDNRSP